MRSLLFLLLSSVAVANYWQQYVRYEIWVKLDDEQHRLTGKETFVYYNNSPDTLTYLWIHLWPNAYKNDQTPLARQKKKFGSRRFANLAPEDRGWIEIKDVSGDGKPIKWRYKAPDTLDVAYFPLPAPLSPGDSMVFKLKFEIQVPLSVSRFGHKDQHYECTQWYPKPAVYDRYGWHPISYLDQGEFYSEWGDFTVHITVPRNYRVAATGVLQDSSEIQWREELAAFGNRLRDSLLAHPKIKLDTLQALIKQGIPPSDSVFKTITFRQNRVHDFAWFADKRYLVLKGYYRPAGRAPVALYSYVLPSNFKNFRHSIEYIHDAVKYYSRWFMPYPYSSVTVVDGDFSAGGGMEYPMITVINKMPFQTMLEDVIMHEVGHNWFYGLSGSNEREHPWLDEGLNSYAEARYWRTKYRDDLLIRFKKDNKPFLNKLVKSFVPDMTFDLIDELAYYSSANSKSDQPPGLTSEAFSRSNYGAMVYKKTAVATKMLHAYLGEALIDSAWHVYFRRWAFKHPYPEDLQAVFEEVTGKTLDWYFDGLINSTGKLDFALEKVSHRGPRQVEVVVINHGDFAAPCPVGLEGPQEQKKIVWLEPFKGRLVTRLQVPFEIKKVVLDPELVVPEMNRLNNYTIPPLSIHWLELPISRGNRYDLWLYPWLTYDERDGLIPGMILLRGGPPPLNRSWWIYASYGLVSHEITWAGGAKQNFYLANKRVLTLSYRGHYSWTYRQGRVEMSFRNPTTTIKLGALRQAITPAGLSVPFDQGRDTLHYLDAAVWEKGRFDKLIFQWYQHKDKRSSRPSITFQTTIGYRRGDKNPYGKTAFLIRHTFSLGNKRRLDTRYFLGTTWGEVPTQEYFYYSSDIDPNLERVYFLTHSSDTPFRPGGKFGYSSLFSLPGFVAQEHEPVPGAENLIGLSAATSRLFYILNIFAGAALAQEPGNTGWKPVMVLSPFLSLGPLELYYPALTYRNGQRDFHVKQFQVLLNLDKLDIPFVSTR